MEHQYKNPNKQLATAQNRNQTAPVANSQDLQTMELVDQQDVAGNDFVAEQLPAHAPRGMTAGPASASPWDMNLFSASRKGISDVEWAKESNTTHDLKGRPRTGTKTIYSDKGTLAEGKHGDFTYDNKVRVRRMSGAELSYDVDKVNTQERSANVNGIDVSEKASQQYLGGGHYIRDAKGETDKGLYGGFRSGKEATAKVDIQNGTLSQTRANSYSVDAKRENGVTSGGFGLQGSRSATVNTSVNNVDQVEQRAVKGGLSSNFTHSKEDGFSGSASGELGRTRNQTRTEKLADGATAQRNLSTGRSVSGTINRGSDGKIAVSGKAGVNGSVSKQVDSVDAQGRTIRNTAYAKGSADVSGSLSSGNKQVKANASGEVGAGRDVTWKDQGGDHKKTMGVSLSGGANHDVLTNKTDLNANLNTNHSNKVVQAINENTTQTKTLDQGFTAGSRANLEKGKLDKDSIAVNAGYNIAHRTEDHTQKENLDNTVSLAHKAGVTGAIDKNQKKVGVSYGVERGNKSTIKEGNTTSNTNSNVRLNTAADHDFASQKSNLKGDIGYSTGISSKTKVDEQTQVRSGHQHDVSVGGSVALENNASKVAGTTKNAGYTYTTTQGKTTNIDGRMDSIDHTNKTAVKASNAGSGTVVGIDHDYTREKKASWSEKDELHATNNKLTVGGGLQQNKQTKALDVAARMGMITGHSITKQVDEATKNTHGVSHNVSGAVRSNFDGQTKKVKDGSVQASYGIGIQNAVEKKTDTGSVTTSSNHDFGAKSNLQKNSQDLDLSYSYGSGKKVVTDTGSKENSTTHKISLGGGQSISRAEEEAKKSHSIRAGYDLSHSEREVVKEGSESVINSKNSTVGGNVGYNVQDKKLSTGIRGEYLSEKVRKDGSKVVSRQENSASIDQDGKANLSRKTEDVGYEKVTNPTDEMRVKTQKGVFSSELNASSQKEASGDRSLSVGGKVGYSAFKQDYSFKAKALSTKVSGLHQGDRDVDGQDRVRTLQKSLNKAGQRIEVNGIFDAATTAAVQKFQKAHGLSLTQQGEIDGPTAAALPEVRVLPEGSKFDASVEAGTVSAEANLKSTFKADQVKVEGVAGAKVTMVGGNAKIAVPVFNWGLGGEQMAVTVTAGVNAEVLAEANGNIKLDVGKSDKGINAHIEGGGKAFVGARAGVEVGAEVEWKKNSAQHYGDLIKRFASSLPGTWDDHLINRVPQEIWPQLAQVLVGSGTSTLMYARAGVEGQAGLGAEATFNAGIKNGMIEASGSFGGSFGLGGSAKTSVGLHAIDGVRLGGVLAMKGTTWLADTLPSAKAWLKNVETEMKRKIDNYMEEKKKKGGIGGFFAKAVDFVGDDVFNLW